jgi:amino acid transporter
MELWLAALIIVGAAALSAAGMLIVRRRARRGKFFKDPVPLGAVYAVAGTAYMVIVAFVFFIAFETYGGAKEDAEKEATATLAMFQDVELFGPAARELQEQMVCYAREVISYGWPAMREGRFSPVVDARVSAMEKSAEQIPVNDAKQAAAFEHWFALNEERRQGRQGRIGEADGLVPPVIWLILIIGAVVVIGSVALFADREEAAVTQAAMAATVAIIVVSGLVLVRFLDKPYEDKSGSIRPTAMERTLTLMEREHLERGQAVTRCADFAG